MNTPTNLPSPVVAAAQGGVAGAPGPAPTTALVGFPLTIFPDLTGNTLTVEHFTVASLAQRIRDTRAERREDQPVLSACRFGDTRSDHNSLRNNGNVLGVTAVIIDYDRGGPGQLIKLVVQKLIEANVAFVLHTTGRNRLDAVRIRLIFPLSTEHAPDEYPRLVEIANFLFGGGAAPESGVLSQPWFFGCVKSVDFEIHYHDGTPLDLHVGLERRPLDTRHTDDQDQKYDGSNPTGALGANALAAALGPRPANLPDADLSINEAASANWSMGWFDELAPEIRHDLLQAIMRLPDIVAIADQPRNEGWRSGVFALVYAGHQGTPGAYEIALDWSQISKRFDQADFDKVWHSFKPDRLNGITVGTLLAEARDAGFDFTGYLAHLGTSGKGANTSGAATSGAAPAGANPSNTAGGASTIGSGSRGGGGGGSVPGPQPRPTPGPQPGPRPSTPNWVPPAVRTPITVSIGAYHLAADAGVAALHAAGVPFYRQADRIVRVCRVPLRAATGEDTAVPLVATVPDAALHRALDQVARWQRYDKQQKQHVDIEPPGGVVDQIANMVDGWPFQPLRGISATPTLRIDGTLLTAPGYDQATGLFLFDPPPLPPIPDQPSEAEARVALQLLKGLLAEFAFAADGGVSHAAALSLLMAGVLRGVMPVAPMYVIRKPSPGTGGSYLVDVASAIAVGDRAGVMAWSPSAEENEKRLIAAVLAQRPLIAIDNVNGRLASDFLCQLAERPQLTCRPLGRSAQIEIANSSLVVANGNNLEISSDEVRRTILIMLDANVENPDTRVFTRDPVGEVLADRGRHIAAVLTIARAYLAAGTPGLLPPRASYEIWSDIVRSPLVWLGEPDPVLSVDQVRTQDPLAAPRAAVFDAWANELVLGHGYQVSELASAASEYSPTGGGKRVRPALRESLLQVAASRSAPDSFDHRRLSHWLRHNDNAVTAGCKLTADYSDKARPRYILRSHP